MKKSKIIIPALAMLVMSTAATVTGTVAWFSMNKTVTAEGMKISAEGQGSIIITKYVDDSSKNYGLPRANDRTTGVDFADSNAHSFQPSTHDLNTYASGLKYISTGGNTINPETGTPANATALSELVYSNASANTHYYDYDVYIAGDGASFDDATLTITLEDVTAWGSGNSRPSIMNAVAVDFYGGASASTGSQAPVQAYASEAGYLGTLNLANRENLTDHTYGTKASIVMTGIDIPQAVTSGGNGTAGYSIKMRAFFDGALIDQAGTNGYVTLHECGASETVAQYQADGVTNKYFYNADGAVMEEIAGMTSTIKPADKNYWVVDTTASTTTFARTAEIVNIEDVSLKVTFSLGA
jgi:hypothetical protein